MKKLIGLALGTLVSLGMVTSAFAAGPNVAAPARIPDVGIEVIVVTAKRPAVQPVDAARPIAELIVTAKRAVEPVRPAPPAMPIEIPKLTLSVAEPATRL